MLNKKEKLLFELIIVFDRKANELIKLLADQYDLDLRKTNPFTKLITRSNNLWKGSLKSNWKYQFHGDTCFFDNSKTGQKIDVKINRNGNYGTIHIYGLYQFIETTKTFNYLANDLISDKNNFETLLEELERKNFILEIDQSPFSTKILNRDKLITFLNKT